MKPPQSDGETGTGEHGSGVMWDLEPCGCSWAAVLGEPLLQTAAFQF